MQDRKTELGNAPIGRLLVTYSTPAMIAMFVSSLYNLVDTIFVGHGAGTLALAGMAVAWPIQMIIIAMGMAVGIGTASIVSRSLGSNDHDRAERVAGTSFVTIAVMSLLLSMIGLAFLEPLLKIFGATEAVLPYAADYMSIIFFGNFFMACSISANSVVRSEGAARVAMTSMILGAVVNVILDPIFIFGLDMGIRGAAVATVIANICTFTFLCLYFVRGNSMLKIKRSDLRPNVREIPEIFKIGSASFFSMVAGSLMAIPINLLIIRHGADIHLAIVGVVNRATMFFFLPIFGLTQGLQPIIGFNYGAKNFGRVTEAVRTAATYATIMSVIAFVILMFGTGAVLSMFSPDAELIEKGKEIVRIVVICMPFIGFQMVGGSLFQALGKAKPAFVLALSRQVLVLLPLLFVLPKKFGLIGLWACFPIADFASFLMTAAWVWVEMRVLRNRHSSSPEPVVEPSVG